MSNANKYICDLIIPVYKLHSMKDKTHIIFSIHLAKSYRQNVFIKHIYI